MKSSGESWYFVGIVISRAHVDAVGNSRELENLMVGSLSNPSGGGYSDPVKKLSTSHNFTSEFSLPAT